MELYSKILKLFDLANARAQINQLFEGSQTATGDVSSIGDWIETNAQMGKHPQILQYSDQIGCLWKH